MSLSHAKQYALLADSGLFDAAWYVREYPELRREPDPINHYLLRGAREGRDPNAFFDTDWYVASQTKLIPDGLNPLVHYLLEGARNGYDPSPYFQSRWFAESAPSTASDARSGLAEYLSGLSPLSWERSPRCAVYTAIFGDYDEPKPVADPDERIQYVLFTDRAELKAPPPWEVRCLPRIFADPQLDARRVKSLPHLFLPDFDVSAWIDASCTPLRLNGDDLRRLSEFADIVLPLNEDYSSIYDEAEDIIWHRLDSPKRVRRQMQSYRMLGFPERYGSHHTCFVIRRHLRASSIEFANAWWEQIWAHSKRDQLSFDFVTWKLNFPVLSLFIKFRNNAVFQWAWHKRRKIRFVEMPANLQTRMRQYASALLCGRTHEVRWIEHGPHSLSKRRWKFRSSDRFL